MPHDFFCKVTKLKEQRRKNQEILRRLFKKTVNCDIFIFSMKYL